MVSTLGVRKGALGFQTWNTIIPLQSRRSRCAGADTKQDTTALE